MQVCRQYYLCLKLATQLTTQWAGLLITTSFGRGHDTVGNPHRAQMYKFEIFRAQIVQFELFELIFLFELDKQFPVEQFEARRAIRADSTSVRSTLSPS